MFILDLETYSNDSKLLFLIVDILRHHFQKVAFQSLRQIAIAVSIFEKHLDVVQCKYAKTNCRRRSRTKELRREIEWFEQLS